MAIATHERTLFSDRTPLDRDLYGIQPLTAQEIRGRDLFVANDCNFCHGGPLLMDHLFHNIGVRPQNDDLGRFNVTGDAADLHKFKVPSLRNVALTAPYLHDGSATTLQEAVQVMARYQMGRELEDREARLIVAFLETLTGESAVRP